MIKIQAIDIVLPEMDQDIQKEWIHRFTDSYGKKIGELFYLFCSDEYLYKMNVARLGHDFYTDIITFPLNDCTTFLSGEFYISLDRIKDNAITYKRTFRNELDRVMAHGVLHLIGYKDKSDEDAKTMRLQEEKCLNMRELDL